MATTVQDFESQFIRDNNGNVDQIQVRSPGRINVIGEHVDHAGGTVLPAGIAQGTTVTVLVPGSPSGGAPVPATAINVWCNGKSQLINVNDFVAIVSKEGMGYFNKENSPYGWVPLIVGSIAYAWESTFNGKIASPKNNGGVWGLTITGNVPLGAGMSSSASFCVAAIGALQLALQGNGSAKKSLEACPNAPAFNTLSVDRKTQISLLAQKVEWNYSGCKCGIMDQMASTQTPEPDTCIQLDCTSLKFTPHKLADLINAPASLANTVPGAKFVLVNSMVKHQLGGQYNEMRAELEASYAAIQKYTGNPKWNPSDYTAQHKDRVGDVLEQEFAEQVFGRSKKIDPATGKITKLWSCYLRLHYVVGEIARVTSFTNLLAQAKASPAQSQAEFEARLTKAGKILSTTHQGLSAELRVSCEELDYIQDWLLDPKENHRNRDGFHVYGARMMGGGFGGCVLALVQPTKVGADAASLIRKSPLPGMYPSKFAGVSGPCDVIPAVLGRGLTVSLLKLSSRL